MLQLEMVRKAGPARTPVLCDECVIEHYRGTEEERQDWVLICKEGLLPPDATVQAFTDTIVEREGLDPEKHLYFVIYKGKRVGTFAAFRQPDGTGYLHMVALLPECRGLGIGTAMAHYAAGCFEDLKCDISYLSTDDFRLSAVVTYVRAGFVPYIRIEERDELIQRWNSVLNTLGISDLKYEYEA